MIKDYINGFQHAALPAKDLDATVRFYEGLGFEVANRSKTDDGVPVVFLKLGTCVIESWLEPETVGKPGAWDHMSLDVENVDALYEEVKAAGYPITTDGIEALPFWDKGIRFFKTQGPDGESLEFCEIIK